MTALGIRSMSSLDIPAVAEMMAAGGWREREGYLRWTLANRSIRAIVGEVNGSIVASGLATINGESGWVGSIFVDATERSRGYGRAITEAVCSLLEEAGCRTQLLMASTYGRPLYENMGFRVDETYQVFMRRPAPQAPAPPPGRSLRQLTPADLAAVLELDGQATGEDRSALIEPLLAAGWGIESDGRLRAFLVSLEPREGAVIAPDADDAVCLLDQLRHQAFGRADAVQTAMPLVNEAGCRRLAAIGWKRAFQTPRMVLGPSVAWQPESIWGVLSFGFG